MFESVSKQSLSAAVYDQLCSRIINRELAAGDELPSERLLCDMLGVNRGAVREGIKRLQQAGLVRVSQGGPTVVLDFEEEAGLEMLPTLLVDGEGRLRVGVARAIVSLRQSMAPQIARQAALKCDDITTIRLDALVADMRKTEVVVDLQSLAFEYWDVVVKGSGNIAYRLAFNSLRKTYKRIWALLTQAMAAEFQDVERLAALSNALRVADSDKAYQLASEHIAIGSDSMNRVLDIYQQSEGES